MKKKNIIEELREKQIAIDKWSYKQVGRFNEGPFKQLYQNLIVSKEKENIDLIDISSVGLVGKDYYFKKFFSSKQYINYLTRGIIGPDVFLRKTHAERLTKADLFLRKNGLFINVVSGWRHPEVQRSIKEDYARVNGKKMAERMFASTEGKVPPPHSTGAAFDVEIKYLRTGKKLNTTVYFDKTKVSSLYWGEELLLNGQLKKREGREAIKNRRILYHILCQCGPVFSFKKDLFFVHPGEYWHFGEGETLSTFLARKKIIKYGVIFPAKQEGDSPDIE